MAECNVHRLRTVRDMDVFQRPREKFENLGAEAMATEELLAILLRTGSKGRTALDLSKEVLELFGSQIHGLNYMNVEALKAIKGIGRDKAITLCAALELGRRMGQARVAHTYEDFSNPRAVAAFCMERMRYHREERFCVALLNVRNRLIGIETISVGGLTASLAEQRAIFKKAVDANAAAMILLHNHPSGDPQPSQSDIDATQVLMKAGEIMGIPVLDHIVIGDGIFVSLREEALM